MNQQAQTHRFRSEDFEPNRQISGLAIFCVVTGLCLVVACSFVAGMEFQAWVHEQAAKAAAMKAPPARPAMQRFDPFAFYCKDQQGWAEFKYMCTARKRMTKVGS